MLFKTDSGKDPTDDAELLGAVLCHARDVWDIDCLPNDILWACMNLAIEIERLYSLMKQVAIGEDMCPVISADGEHIIGYIPAITPK